MHKYAYRSCQIAMECTLDSHRTIYLTDHYVSGLLFSMLLQKDTGT